MTESEQEVYLQLRAERDLLKRQMKLLTEENDRLRSRLGVERTEYAVESLTPVMPDAMQRLSLQEKIELFRSLFRGREDVFARRWFSKTSGKSGYQPVCEREWDARYCDKKRFKCAECPNRQFKPLTYDDYYNHLAGKKPNGEDVIGIYAILEDNTCCFLCTDFDDKNCEHGYQSDVLAFVSVCKDWGIPYSIERSRSGNGAQCGYSSISLWRQRKLAGWAMPS